MAERKTVYTERAGGAPVIYSDSISVNMNVFGFQMKIGRIVSANPEQITIVHEAVVGLSPQHLKALAKLFQENVERYEQQYGPVAIEGRPSPAVH